jgi:LPXTG-site transpeptidase (sortase) family protein
MGRGRRWLAGILIIIGAGIIVYPFVPRLIYYLHHPTPTLPYVTRLTANSAVIKDLPHLPTIENKPVPKENRLLILEGPNERTLDRGGIWHIPGTATPDQNGNFVVSGHRWQYLPPSSLTLYLLDKVKNGDPVIVYWRGLEYDYRIYGRATITPDRTDIQAPTNGPRLTIYTCTPLFSTKYRLVLFGQLIP